MKKYALQQARRLLNRLHVQIGRAAEQGDPDAIHDLRVAIRRFNQCLRVFAQFFPTRKARKIRGRLKGIMDLAAEVRDRDIALELLDASGIRNPQLVARLRRDRGRAGDSLLEEIRRVRGKRLEI